MGKSSEQEPKEHFVNQGTWEWLQCGEGKDQLNLIVGQFPWAESYAKKQINFMGAQQRLLDTRVIVNTRKQCGEISSDGQAGMIVLQDPVEIVRFLNFAINPYERGKKRVNDGQIEPPDDTLRQQFAKLAELVEAHEIPGLKGEDVTKFLAIAEHVAKGGVIEQKVSMCNAFSSSIAKGKWTDVSPCGVGESVTCVNYLPYQHTERTIAFHFLEALGWTERNPTYTCPEDPRKTIYTPAKERFSIEPKHQKSFIQMFDQHICRAASWVGAQAYSATPETALRT